MEILSGLRKKLQEWCAQLVWRGGLVAFGATAAAMVPPSNCMITHEVISLSYRLSHSVIESDPIVYAWRDDYFCNLSLYQDLEL